MSISGMNSLKSMYPNLININNNQNNNKNIDSTSNTKGFSDFLKDALNTVNDLQMQSKNATEDFIVGKNDNLHELMIIGEKSDIALQFTLQVRNKILDAYNEIMRMPI